MSPPSAGGVGVGLVVGALCSWRWRPGARALAAAGFAAVTTAAAVGALAGPAAVVGFAAGFASTYLLVNLGREHHG